MSDKQQLYRSEHDSVGERAVPKDVYYGVQSLRAAENFPITGLAMHPELINSIAEIKKASAITNYEIGLLEKRVADAIVAACEEIAAGKLHEAFIVDPIQGGAGTSLNMNANEVIANRAIELLGGEKGDYRLVNPNDHVNYGQSTNDVFPSAGKLAVLKLLVRAQIQLERLYQALVEKAEEFDGVIKMGRTQMQDAVPIRLGQEFRAYSEAVRRDIARFERAKDEMRCLNMGGTAIGTGINADEQYLRRIVPNLSKVTGLSLVQAFNLIDATQNLDEFVAVSGAVKTCAVNLSKMSNDLRLMSSGPRCGFGEINLPPRQNGSSIMPGKVNPTQCEAVTMVAVQVIANDTAIGMAASQGNFQLNVFLPVSAYNFLLSTQLLADAMDSFRRHCVDGIIPNAERMRENLNHSLMLVTCLTPRIGYEAAAMCAKKALADGTTLKDAVLALGLLTAQEFDEIVRPETMV